MKSVEKCSELLRSQWSVPNCLGSQWKWWMITRTIFGFPSREVNHFKTTAKNTTQMWWLSCFFKWWICQKLFKFKYNLVLKVGTLVFPECQKRRVAQPSCFLICHSCLKSMSFFFFACFCFFSNLKLPTEKTKKDIFKGHCD